MNDFWTVVFMTVIGSIIGGSTNHIAIQMLFRPYNAKYIGKWRIPFTPGLIPSRRDELAIELGKTVEKYLMTPEMLKAKLSSSEVKDNFIDFLNNKWNSFLENEKSIYYYLESSNKIDYLNVAENKIRDILLSKIDNLKNDINNKELISILGEDNFLKVSEKLPIISHYILSNAMNSISSTEGEELIRKMTEDFLVNKGKFAGVVSSLVVDNKSLNDKIRKELINLLKSEKTFNSLNNLFNDELIKISKIKGSFLLDTIDISNFSNNIVDSIMNGINLKGRLDIKLSDIILDLDKKVRNDYIPSLVNKILSILIENVELILNQIDIKEIVRKEVDKFPVEQLENLLLGISKKEFKMITYLGFLLGGIISVIQGLIVVLF